MVAGRGRGPCGAKDHSSAERPSGCCCAVRALRTAAEQDHNVIGPMLDCARAYCTLFEIRSALERVYGAYREPVFF